MTTSVAKPQDSTPMDSTKPSDLRGWDSNIPLYVRNNREWAVSFDDFKGNIMYLTHKAGGENIGVLPIEIARNPGFQKMWRRGHFTVSTDPALEDELFLMEQREEELAHLKAQEVLATMGENPQNNDKVHSTCLHCGDGIFISFTQSRNNDKPSLCVQHEDLAPLFAKTSSVSETGATVEKWVAVSLGELQKTDDVGTDPRPTKVTRSRRA